MGQRFTVQITRSGTGPRREDLAETFLGRRRLARRPGADALPSSFPVGCGLSRAGTPAAILLRPAADECGTLVVDGVNPSDLSDLGRTVDVHFGLPLRRGGTGQAPRVHMGPAMASAGR